jgi:PTS system nitrogen regulatory IIA component
MPASILRQTLRPELVRLQLTGETKDEIIGEMVQILADAGELPDPQDALQAVQARETVMSTGMENGLAIPHGKTDTVQEMVACVGLKPEGVDFGSVDGEPSRIFLTTVSPASKTGPHLRLMADVTRLMMNGELREQVLGASTPDEVVELLAQA